MKSEKERISKYYLSLADKPQVKILPQSNLIAAIDLYHLFSLILKIK